ncbi:MAG: LytTR family transcriptional regulator DNA-binding domain-containing protein [Lachnospiraceae bacterium]|nr:LytTR family transcriptional regulator DNA-binding domain-containing protein [Lachnospiraceae bacterium]
MKITIETPKPGEEDEIILRCASVDDRLLKLIQSFRNEKDMLTGYVDDRIQKLALGDIFYFEAVDNKVYAYTAKQVYEVHKKLYEIEEEYANTDFLRISKAIVVNVSKITYIRPMLNGRFEAKLKNDEKVIISRQYVPALKEKLDL